MVGPASTVADGSIPEFNRSSQNHVVQYSHSNHFAHPQINYMSPTHGHPSRPTLDPFPQEYNPFPPALDGYDPRCHPVGFVWNSPSPAIVPITRIESPPDADANQGPFDSDDKNDAFCHYDQPQVPQSFVVASPLHPASPPSNISSEADRPSPVIARLNNNPRHPGQRVDVDQFFLDGSFNKNDDRSRLRRAILNDIKYQGWFLNHEKEPQIESRNDPFCRGLGTVGRSIYTVFLDEDKESNQWRCLFGGDNNVCKKAEKRFERVERAIEHIRSHLGHRPFACDGTCLKSQTTNTPWYVSLLCAHSALHANMAYSGKRFFASGYLEDHKKRPQKRTSGSQ
jgi:hypothetical protein